MSSLKERIAYLQGLTKGLNVTEQSPEGKLLIHMLDFLDDLATEADRLRQEQDDLLDYVETIDEHVAELENEVYSSALSPDNDSSGDTSEDQWDDSDDDVVEVECPQCHEVVTFEASILDEEDELEVSCPDCGTVVYEQKSE